MIFITLYVSETKCLIRKSTAAVCIIIINIIVGIIT